MLQLGLEIHPIVGITVVHAERIIRIKMTVRVFPRRLWRANHGVVPPSQAEFVAQIVRARLPLKVERDDKRLRTWIFTGPAD